MKIKGNKLTMIRTLGNGYNSNIIEVTHNTGKKDKGGVFNICNHYRIKVEEILPLIQKHNWICEKAINHTYLTEPTGENHAKK